jgi:hypothetical protein
MSGWTVGKMALALVGIAMLLLADNLGRPWIGYAGLVPIAAAFLLRFVQRRFDPQRKDSAPPL